MDIDLGILRTLEREKEIPFAELVSIIEAAILAAYFKNCLLYTSDAADE